MMADIDATMEASILDSLFNHLSTSGGRLYMDCPSPFCRWDKFVTAGVCLQCNNVSSQLVRYDNWATLSYDDDTSSPSMNVSAYFLPNRAYLSNLNGDLTVFSNGGSISTTYDAISFGKTAQMMGFATGNPGKTVSMGGDVKPLIWSLAAVQVNYAAFPTNASFRHSWPDLPVLATECALYYCDLERTSSIVNGSLQETDRELNLVRNPDSFKMFNASRFPFMPSNVSDSLEFDPYTAAIRRTDLKLQDPNNESTSFNFTQEAVHSISSYFQSTFQSSLNLTKPRGDDRARMTLQSPDFPKGKANVAFYVRDNLPKRSAGIWNSEASHMFLHFRALSVGMTTAMRNTMANVIGKPGDPSAEVGNQFTVYTVRWVWITLHGAVIVGGTVFFIATVRSSSEAERTLQCLVWKNSSLAVISKAPELGLLFEVSDSIRQLEEKAMLKTATFNHKEG